MRKAYVVPLVLSWVAIFCSISVICGPGRWKTVPYTAYYGDTHREDGPGPGLGHGQDQPSYHGHGQYGYGNTYGRRQQYGPPSPALGSGYGADHGIGHGHSFGNHGYAKRNGKLATSPSFIPLPAREKTAYIQKLIPILQFGGVLKKLFHYEDDFSSSDWGRTTTGESPWPWQW